MTQPAQPDDARTSGDAGSSPATGPDAWAAWADDLAQQVRALADGASLTVTAPEAAARPARLRKARLRGFLPARHSLVAPWVRLTRSEEHLRGHCVGSEAVGGRFPLAPEEHSALAALGWHEPPRLEGEDYTHWWPDDVPNGPYLPADEARRAAIMVADTFRTVLAAAGEDAPSPGLPRVTSD